MLKIGDFSKLSRVSIRMLRHYDDIFEKGENVSLTKLDSIFTKLQFTIIIRIV